MACVRQLQSFLYLTLINLLSLAALVASTSNTPPPSDCPDKCGNITIPYPFGMHPECYRDGFHITCNESTTPPKAYLGSGNVELIDINITSGEARVINFIGYACYNQTSWVNYSNSWISTKETPYLFSNSRNRFIAIGCYTLAYIDGQGDSLYQSGCVSFCDGLNGTTGDGGSCNGLGCCQTTIPAGLNYNQILWGFNGNKAWSFNPCSYAMLMQDDWYNFTVQDLQGFGFFERNKDSVPIVLDWAVRENGTCLESHVESSFHPACQSNHSGCHNTTNGEGYICKCLPGYEGNPYLPDGCTDIDECKFPNQYPCTGSCNNTDGNYECFCPKDTKGDGKAGNCTKIPDNFPYPARVAIASIIGVAILLGLCFLVAAHKQHKRHIKEKEEYKKYYQMMDNHLRVFSKKQIENATNNFDEGHVLGVGGQGKVYKGLLENNQVVAIKKAKKEVEETQRGEFVNKFFFFQQ